MILSLIAASTPAGTPTSIVALAKESRVSLAIWFHTSGLAKLIQGHSAGKAGAQAKQSDRDAKVSRIQIFPGDVTVDLGKHVSFSAVAYDQDNTPVGGVKIKWSGQSSVPGLHVHLSQRGEFEATTPGKLSIMAEGVGKTSQVTVVVSPGVRRNLSLAPISTRRVSTRDLPNVRVGSTQELRRSDGSSAVVSRAGDARGRHIVTAKWAHSSPRKSMAAPIVSYTTILDAGVGGHSRSMPGRRLENTGYSPMTEEGSGWGDSNYLSADDPENGVGNPPGVPLDGGAGSGNFQFMAPILGLPARGINVALGLAYNSRVWNKAGTQISFDNDRAWPAPGFSLGFGKLLGMGVFNGGMLVDADGTRHSHTGSLSVFNWGTNFVGHTTDGSFIDYSYWSGTGGGKSLLKRGSPMERS